MDYLGPISSAVMAVIWIVYFQLFFFQYKRNNRCPVPAGEYGQRNRACAVCAGGAANQSRRSEDSDSDYLFEDITAVEIRAAVVHGPSRYPVGVRRSFRLEHEGGPEIFPRNIHSEQLTRRRDRHEVRRWLESELCPERKGQSESDSSDQSG